MSSKPRPTGLLQAMLNPKPGQGSEAPSPAPGSSAPANDQAPEAVPVQPVAPKPTAGQEASHKKPNRVQVLVRMNEEHRHLLQLVAWEKRTTVQDLAEEVLLDILRRHGKI